MKQEKKKYEEPRRRVIVSPLPNLFCSSCEGDVGEPDDYENGGTPFSE